MGISCDICKYGSSNDYVDGNYYCRKNVFSYDKPMIHNCSDGEIDDWKYNFKYKPTKSNTMVNKSVIYEEIEKIMWGIKLKSIDEIMEEINALKSKITDYREPYKCETCAVEECQLYANGCRNCSGWK